MVSFLVVIYWEGQDPDATVATKPLAMVFEQLMYVVL